MKRSVRVGIFCIVLVALAYGIYARIRYEKSQVPLEAHLSVHASFYPLAEFASKVGGDLVSVTNMTPAGAEPHEFDPSPKDIAMLESADVFLYNGAGFESWAERVVPALAAKGTKILNASMAVNLIEDDPHVWLDPVRMSEQVHAIGELLATADSAHAATYRAHAQKEMKELVGLDREFREGLIHCKRHDIVTSHAAFTYLADRYGLTMIPIAGISPDEEPSPQQLGEIATLVRERGITHIFFEALVSAALSQTIARETGTMTLALNPIEGLTREQIEQGQNYISLQKENLNALKSALGCT